MNKRTLSKTYTMATFSIRFSLFKKPPFTSPSFQATFLSFPHIFVSWFLLFFFFLNKLRADAPTKQLEADSSACMAGFHEDFLFFFFRMDIYLFIGPLTACGILVPQPGIEPVPPEVEAKSPNHWTTRKFSHFW